MGSITVFKGNSLPSFLVADEADNEEFAHGAGEGFGVISYRGKVWRLKHKGEEHLLSRDGEVVSRINVVLLRANKSYSKIYYAKKYVEGDDAAPDCFSSDGSVPDPSVERPQCKSCDACPMNVWGSRMTDEGKKAKACQDSRRMAVLLADPTLDVSTDEPVLLRIPPASLNELKTYADGMSRAGVPLYKIITQISFDTNASFPKLMFKAYGWDEAALPHWLDLRDGETVKRILNASEVEIPRSGSAGSAVRSPMVNTAAQEEEEEEEEQEEEEEVVQPTQQTKAATSAPTAPPRKTTTRKKPTKVEEEPDAPQSVDLDDMDPDDLVNSLLGAD